MNDELTNEILKYLNKNGSISIPIFEHNLSVLETYYKNMEPALKNINIPVIDTSIAKIIFDESLFIYLFSCIETSMNDVFSDFNIANENKISFAGKEKLFQKIEHLSLIANTPFPSNGLRNEYIAYKNIRNAIVHRHGLIGLKKEEEETVVKLDSLKRDSDGCLEYRTDFFMAFIVFCRNYIYELKKLEKILLKSTT